MPEDNSHAGKGAVLLDIGGDIGALVVTMPAAMEGIEVEIRPVGAADTASDDAHLTAAPDRAPAPEHTDEADHPHGTDQQHLADHTHGTDHTHDHPSPWPHVAVVARPAPAGIVHSLVYAQLRHGSYELYVRPHGPVRLRADVIGGQVTEAIWPR